MAGQSPLGVSDESLLQRDARFLSQGCGFSHHTRRSAVGALDARSLVAPMRSCPLDVLVVLTNFNILVVFRRSPVAPPLDVVPVDAVLAVGSRLDILPWRLGHSSSAPRRRGPLRVVIGSDEIMLALSGDSATVEQALAGVMERYPQARRYLYKPAGRLPPSVRALRGDIRLDDAAAHAASLREGNRLTLLTPIIGG